jgi:serine/threonine protein kinase
MHKEQQDCDARFNLLEKLGEGTYGVVYKAFDGHLKQVSVSYQH